MDGVLINLRFCWLSVLITSGFAGFWRFGFDFVFPHFVGGYFILFGFDNCCVCLIYYAAFDV